MAEDFTDIILPEFRVDKEKTNQMKQHKRKVFTDVALYMLYGVIFK